MARKPKRPARIRLGDLIAYAKSPPTKSDPRWYWQIVTPAPGRQVHVATGRWTQDEVLDELARRRQHADYRPAWQAGTLGALLLRWCEAQLARPKLAAQTRRLYLNCGRVIATHAGDIPLSRMDGAALEQIRTELEGVYAPRTVRQHLGSLRQAWKWGRLRGLTPDRELPRIRLPPVREKLNNDRTPSHEEVRAVLEATPDGWPRLALELLYATGARVSEVCNLRWDDIHPSFESMTIGRGGKTGARTVHVGGEVVSLLRQARDQAPEAELVVATTASNRRGSVSGQLKRACRRADVPAFTAHGLRRRAVNDLYRQGVDIPTACSIVGQTPQTMARHYARAREGEGRKAAALVLGRGAALDNVLPFKRSAGE